MGNKQSSPPDPGPPPAEPIVLPVIPKFEKKRPETLSLQLGPGKSDNCLTCAITVDPTLSSSTVVLTRDILGKIERPGIPYPPSNLPNMNSRPSRGGGYEVPYPSKLNGIGQEVTTLSWKTETILSDQENGWQDTTGKWDEKYNNQKALEEKHKKEWDKKYNGKMGVRIWNPSDDPTDPQMSIAINNLEFGALTKLFIKPTIPFPVSFSLAGPNVVKTNPPLPSTDENERQKILNEQTAAGDRAEREKEARQAQAQ